LVQTKLQERFDTVPNLAEIVKGSAKHEKEILTAIANARTKYNNAFSVGDTEGMLEANESINTVVSKIDENYPEIAALDLYKDFKDEYLSLEAAVTVARDNYNAAVRNYNDSIDMFWGSIIANMKGMKPENYFEASAKAEQGVINANLIAGVDVLKSQIADTRAVLAGITRTAVPSNVICNMCCNSCSGTGNF
jgi:LemA protein